MNGPARPRASAVSAPPMREATQVEKITYLNLPNCYRLSNGSAELVVTTDVGPRVIRYGFAGRENVFAEVPEKGTVTELGVWKPWGGHRLWVAPERMPGSYAPDSGPVGYEVMNDLTIRLSQPTDAAGVQKEMTVALAPEGTGVKVNHRITNRNLWPIDAAPWASTIVRGGGETILPLAPFCSHDECLSAAQPLVRWRFTDLSDPRFTHGEKYVRLRTDERLEPPQKIGLGNTQGWCAYRCDATLFVKRFDYDPRASYPDFGSNNEAYTTRSYMEVESIGPLRRLEPGESAEHEERWYLFRDEEAGADEQALDASLRTILERAM